MDGWAALTFSQWFLCHILCDIMSVQWLTLFLVLFLTTRGSRKDIKVLVEEPGSTEHGDLDVRPQCSSAGTEEEAGLFLASYQTDIQGFQPQQAVCGHSACKGTCYCRSPKSLGSFEG